MVLVKEAGRKEEFKKKIVRLPRHVPGLLWLLSPPWLTENVAERFMNGMCKPLSKVENFNEH